MECVWLLLDMGAEVNVRDKVSGVIINCVHAMQHVPGVPRSEGYKNPFYCIHAMLFNG